MKVSWLHPTNVFITLDTHEITSDHMLNNNNIRKDDNGGGFSNSNSQSE